MNLLYLGAQTLLFLVLTPLLLRSMGEAVYGVWTILLTVIGFAIMTNFGTSSTAIKYTAQFSVSENASEKLSVVLTFCYGAMFAISTLTFAAIYTTHNWLAEAIDTSPVASEKFGNALILIGVSLVPFFLSLVSRGVLLGLVRNGIANSVNLLSDTMLWCGALFISLVKPDIQLLALWILVSHSIRFGLMGIASLWATRSYRLKLAWEGKLVREMIQYSSLVWIGSLGIVMFKTLDRIILGMTVGIVAVGVYSIGTSIAIRLTSLANQFAQLLTPFASSYGVSGHDEQVAVVFRHSARLIGTMLAAAVGILVIWLDVILSIWISSDFSSRYTDIFRILLIVYGIYSMYRPAHYTAEGLGWVKIPTLIGLFAASSTLIAFWLLSSSLGLVGAAYANSVYITIILVHLYVAVRLLDSPFKMTAIDLGPPLLILVGAAILSSYSTSIQWRLFVTITITFFACLSAFGNGRFKLFLHFVSHES